MSRKSSQKRIEANRRNAQKSTGPRTAEGKAASSRNATTHGLSSLDRNPLSPGCFLKIEDANDFKGLLEEYITTYRPQHRDEFDLLAQAVYAYWLQQRGWAAQAAQLEIAIAQNERDLQREFPLANANTHLANGFANCENMMKLYLRYDAQCHRHYKSCLKQLQDLQASRRNDPEPPNEPIEPQPDHENPDRQAQNLETGDPNLKPATPNEAAKPAATVTPIEPKPQPKTDAQLFEEYRNRFLQMKPVRKEGDPS
jgi:hypothetical protein